MSNILSSLGNVNQSATNSAYESVIKAIEAKKQNTTQFAKSINDMVDKANQQALQQEQLRLQNNAQIQNAWNEQKMMTTMGLMGQKNADGSEITAQQAFKMADAGKEEFFKQMGYNDQKTQNWIDKAIKTGASKVADGVKGAYNWTKDKFSKDSTGEVTKESANANFTFGDNGNSSVAVKDSTPQQQMSYQTAQNPTQNEINSMVANAGFNETIPTQRY